MNFKQILKEFRKGMELFAKSIAVFVNSVLLSVVYFLGVGITTVLAKLFKKKFLDFLETSPNAETKLFQTLKMVSHKNQYI